MQKVFRQYHLMEELAKRHSHSTYLACVADEPEHQVALTIFASSIFRFPHEHENLLKKAKRIQGLQHPHVAPILDMGIEQEQPFIVNEYWPAGSLRNRLNQLSSKRLEPGEALNIVLQVGQVLSYAHEHNIVHGNIKPENVFFDTSGQAILTDFSLVEKRDAIIRDQTSQEYAFCYLAPEQFAGTCNSRSDQYALGCLAYELITGQVPFVAQSLGSMMGGQSERVPAPFSQSIADQFPSLEAAVLRTLASDPNQRFFDFSLFLEVVLSILSPPPAFPLLLRSTDAGEKKIVSHLRSLTKTESVSSPIRKHTAKSVVLQSSESLGTSFSTEIEAATPSSLVETSVPSQMGIIDEGNIDIPLDEPEAEAEALWLSDLFKEEDKLLVGTALSAADERSEALPDATSSSLKQTALQRGLIVVSAKRSKRRPLALGLLLLSVVMAVICSALWLSGGSTLFNTALPFTNFISHNPGANLSSNPTPTSSLQIPTNRLPSLPPAIPPVNPPTSFSQNAIIANSTPHTENTGLASNATYRSSSPNTASTGSNINPTSNSPTSSSPASTPTPTAAPANTDPYPPSGTLAMDDPLTDNSAGYGWSESPPASSNGGWACQFIGGDYHAIQTQAGGFTSCHANLSPSNFTLEIQMEVVSGNCGGLVLRDTTSVAHAYIFEVCQDGTYQLFRFDSFSSGQVLQSGSNQAITPGLDQWNVIAAVVDGSTFNLYVNQQEVATVTDSSYTQGQLGICATGSSEAAYSNARMWTL